MTKAQKEAYEKVLTQAPFSTVTTLVGDFLEDAVVAKEGGTMTLQSITSDGISHTYREDIRMKSLQTSLAYSNIVFDLKQILWPQQKEDRWEVLYEKFACNTNTYWKAFDSFKKTTVSEADRKIRNFLAMDYSDSFEGNTIRLNLFGAFTGETTWFILRTHGEEPEVVEGASIVNIEEDAYLIAANQQEVTLKLKNKNELYYSLSD